MTFLEKMLTLFKKHFGEIILALSIFLLGCLVIFDLEIISAEEMIFLATLIYAYLTYKILKESSTQASSPYISAYLGSALNVQEIRAMAGYRLIGNDILKNLVEGKSNPNAILFLILENVGDRTALDLKIKHVHEKVDYPGKASKTIQSTAFDMRPGEKVIFIIETFENNSKTASMKLGNFTMEYYHPGTIGKKISSPRIQETKGKQEYYELNNEDVKVKVLK